MPSYQVDGMRCEDVHEAIESAADRARKGEGPTLLEMKTYRYRGHSMSDPAKYRTKEEVDEYKSKDPIEQVLSTIFKNKWMTEADVEAVEARVKALVDESVQFAEESPFPEPHELYEDVYVQTDYPYITD
jgi:pyruvate dehydrogenase E1 component alpha subunit